MRGRRPKPSALKRLQGNPGKRKLNDREPQLPVVVPDCPAFIEGAVARKEWDRMAPLLAAGKLLTAADQTALAAYCQAYENWVDAERKLRRFGSVLKSPGGFPMVSPYLAVAKTHMVQMHRLLVEFGMTPASRSRLRVEAPPAQEDPFEAYLKRGAAAAQAHVQ